VTTGTVEGTGLCRVLYFLHYL